MSRPYILTAPNYDYTSGGIKVMWGLYGWLLAKGVEVYMNQKPNWLRNHCVGIYPEIQHGNPAVAEVVVRYILNKPGVMGAVYPGGKFVAGPKTFDPTDKIYYFSRMFGKARKDKYYMFLPIINLHIFKDQKKKRTKTCYLIGKGVNKHKHPTDSIKLNRFVARDQQLLADLLNECHTFYCYDKLTAMMEVARLCGTKVKYHGGYTMKELENYEPGLNGINSDLDTRKFRDHYISLIKLFEKRLDRFISDTQK